MDFHSRLLPASRTLGASMRIYEGRSTEMMNHNTKLFAKAVGVDPDRGRPGWIWKTQTKRWPCEWRLRGPWLATVYGGGGLFSEFRRFWVEEIGSSRTRRER
jgi:hypothetical protein